MRAGRERGRCSLDAGHVSARGWPDVVELALERVWLVVRRSAARPQLAGAVTAAHVIVLSTQVFTEGFPRTTRGALCCVGEGKVGEASDGRWGGAAAEGDQNHSYETEGLKKKTHVPMNFSGSQR